MIIGDYDMPSMTKKYYILIADLLAMTLFNLKADESDIQDNIENWCNMLKYTNPQFDAIKFSEYVLSKI